MDKLIQQAMVLLLLLTISCNTMKKEAPPQWTPEMCQPKETLGENTNIYRVELVEDEIYTLEGKIAHMPFGGSSGEWGASGASYTDQYGTPIGATIVYYAGYEDKFYRLEAKFDVEKMKKLVKEIHYPDESFLYQEDLNPDEPYKPGMFNSLIFGFAPQGMVVVWAGYLGAKIEVGRFQAKEITNKEEDKAFEKRLFASWSMNRAQVKVRDFMPNASCALWDTYRKRYHIALDATSENKKFKLFYKEWWSFNGENKSYFRPEILTPTPVSRALPNRIIIDWETGYKDTYRGLVFLNEEAIFNHFKNIPEGSTHRFHVKITADNSDMELFVDNTKIEVDSMRIWPSYEPGEYKDSYKENEK
ncbi:DUF2931 family protein [Flavobacterium columnare]|uniref:DUF2931 family protein n=1 Tax=Flavobacterium columnare TaxID=996 RepID=UPI002D1FF526|nr:DUF2931 family protein [Flavobacterium columnare]MEB3801960.1 DUF2931 family protein [Flavobacterium columnare]